MAESNTYLKYEHFSKSTNHRFCLSTDTCLFVYTPIFGNVQIMIVHEMNQIVPLMCRFLILLLKTIKYMKSKNYQDLLKNDPFVLNFFLVSNYTMLMSENVVPGQKMKN